MHKPRHPHLNVERWFSYIPHPKNRDRYFIRRKRVSASAEAQFPARYREIYVKHGAPALIKALRSEHPQWGLAEAWDHVKEMFNA